MTYRCLVILLILSVTFARAQTQITIIGSAHRETAGIKKKDFYEAIKNSKPDLILIELDSGLMNKDFTFRKFLKGIFEIAVVDSFTATHPNVQVRPFDIEGRNRFFTQNHFFEEEGKMYAALGRLYKNDSLTFQNKVINDAAVYFNALANNFADTDLQTLNSPAADSVIKVKMHWAYHYIPVILASTPALKQFQPHATLDSGFWIKRNHEMAKHILQFSRMFAGKSIVVITGHYHRYFLQDLLSHEEKKYNIKIREFYN